MFSDTNRQLRKLSIRKMQFQVTQIEFDFTDDVFPDEELPVEEQELIVAETCNTIWEACDEDDLIEEITSASGWCIKSVDYVHVLN